MTTLPDVINELPTLWGGILMAIRAALVVWALVGVFYAVRAPSSAFEIEGKLPKAAWVALCSAAAVMFVLFPFGILSIIGMVAVGVFFADVNPAVSGRRR